LDLQDFLAPDVQSLVRTIYGADKADSGVLKVKGKDTKISSPLDAMKAGMAYLPEDRKKEESLPICLFAKILYWHFRQNVECLSYYPANRWKNFADKYIDLLQIKTQAVETPIKSLSGGNQQKVIIARWLLTNPDYLILDEPTRGIDIGTKTEIQKLVLQLADEGKKQSPFISSEIEEMLRTCSRMAVLRDGKKVGEIEEEDLSQESIMKAIAGGDE